ncbi:hypothetical protein BCEN4_1440030 [Burkholderia cenocepacia]|nr:hypothetical protein BCEN4_1440030 [Burkholderia cenocepacia]
MKVLYRATAPALRGARSPSREREADALAAFVRVDACRSERRQSEARHPQPPLDARRAPRDVAKFRFDAVADRHSRSSRGRP